MATRQQEQSTSPINVQKHLKGMDYPADKSEIVEHARSQNAPHDVMSAIESLPDREYESPVDVSSEFGGGR